MYKKIGTIKNGQIVEVITTKFWEDYKLEDNQIILDSEIKIPCDAETFEFTGDALSSRTNYNTDTTDKLIMETKTALLEEELEILKQELISGGVING